MHNGDAHESGSHDAHAGGHHGRAPRSFTQTFVIPLAIPVVAALVIAAIILCISQILLDIGGWATFVALLMAVLILLTAAYFASAPRITRQQVYGALAAPALVLLIAGIGTGIHRQNEKEAPVEGGLSAKLPQEVMTDNKYSVTTYTVPANQAVTIDTVNKGAVQHNLHITDAQDADGNDYKTALTQSQESKSLTFTIATEGVYHFHCDVHPADMVGTITVTPNTTGATAATAASGQGGGGGIQEVTTDNKFSQTSITVAKGVSTSLTVNNKGTALHNFHVTDAKNPDGSDIKNPDFVNPGKTSTITFQIDTPGTYHFWCDVHTADMTGTLTVK